MTFISKTADIHNSWCRRCTKDEEMALRNSYEVRRSIEAVLNGFDEYKEKNYYRLVNGTASDETDEIYRLNENLVASGKVLLDYDHTDWQTAIWPQIQGKEKQLGILHIEESTRGKLHITVRQIQGLTIEQTILWFENLLGVEFDHVKDLARACFLVPMDQVLYVDEAYYDDFVEPQQQDISAFKAEEEKAIVNAYSLTEEQLDRIINEMKETPDDDFSDYQATTTTTTETTPQASTYHRVYEEDEDEFLRIVDIVVKKRIDICPQEPEWFRLGCACYAVLGEDDGREAFHRLSQFYPKYSSEVTEKKFNHVARSMYSQVGLGSLIYWCRQAGVELN